MNTRTLVLLMACAAGAAVAGLQAEVPGRQPEARCANVNLLSPAEQSAGWLLLFDGRSTSGWHIYNKQDSKSWAIEECSLKTTGTESNYGSDKRPDLVTDREFTNFELVVDWKGSKGGNSGIIYGIVEDPKYEAPWMTGPEYQLLDDVGFPEEAGAIPEGRIELRDAGAERSDQDPQADRRVEHDAHRREGRPRRALAERPEDRRVRAVDAGVEGRAGRGQVEGYPDYGMAKTGRIALQDHGSVFWFRNVKIRPLAD